MPPRLGYRKSRNGCVRCKERRVKVSDPIFLCISYYQSIYIVVWWKHPMLCMFRALRCLQSWSLPAEENIARSPTAKYYCQEGINFLKYHLKHLPTHYEVNNFARQQRQHHKLRQAPPCRQPGAYPSDSANVLQASDSDPHKSATAFPISQSLDIWLLRDLELMHHFTAIAWQILPKGYGRQELWQIELPRLALEHDL